MRHRSDANQDAVRLASQCQALPAFGDASSGHWPTRTSRFRAVRGQDRLLYGLSRGLLVPAVAIVTPEQTALVRQSFDAICPVRRKLADQFYRRLLTPDARGLFRSDMERQYRKLMDMIAAIVGTLDKREIFQSIISHSGRQHAQFGAKPMHFAAFGNALIWGLEQQFGAAFTPEMKEAWIKLYDDVQREMMRAGLPGKERRLEVPNPVGR